MKPLHARSSEFIESLPLAINEDLVSIRVHPLTQ